MTRFGIIGWGRIGARIATRLSLTADAPALVAVLVRPGHDTGVRPELACTDIHQFIARGPHVAVEAASGAALAELGPTLLAAGIDVMPLSLSAMADPAVERALLDAAETGPGRLEIPAGALGSLGFLRAAREDRLDRVVFRAAHGPVVWRRTAARDMVDLDRATGPFLRASVRHVARLFPHNLNVAVGVALAGLGLDRTEAELSVDPQLTQARFEVEVWAGPGHVRLMVAGQGVAAGEDPVDYTTFSVIRLLRRRDARVAV